MPVKASICCKLVVERIRKSTVVELLEDVFGAHTLGHLRKLHLRKIAPQARESPNRQENG
jgi:hypothetical protein